MQKFEIIEKLDELKDCKIVRFKMVDGKPFNIPYENIKNYPDIEMIDSTEDNFRCFYCNIEDVSRFL